MRQSRPRPSSRVSRTWQEVPTLSSQVYLYSTFLTDKGCAPARPALQCSTEHFAVSGHSTHALSELQPFASCFTYFHLHAFYRRATPVARERNPTASHAPHAPTRADPPTRRPADPPTRRYDFLELPQRTWHLC